MMSRTTETRKRIPLIRGYDRRRRDATSIIRREDGRPVAPGVLVEVREIERRARARLQREEVRR